MKDLRRFIMVTGCLFILVLFHVGNCGYTASAQEIKSALDVEVYQLENGLTVYLNDDDALPSVLGAIAVRGGSKRDPSDATGVAHYFEHIMFKGTDRLGTVDYLSERPYLDSIAALYDRLSESADQIERNSIQMEINRLSVIASRFAIPNEMDLILNDMGASMVNAGTSNDEIVYFSVVPSNQVQKWLALYGHIFSNPVYRLFQSELETVYEEYNMYRDDRFSVAGEEISRAIYPDHPYGIPILGYPEDLKYPSMKKMDEYYKTYYVANNMALILSGNFSREVVKPLIEQYFGSWRSGEVPVAADSSLVKPFKGRTVQKEHLTPIRFGLRAYRSVPDGHPDEAALDVVNDILSNSAQTGLIDGIVMDNKIMDGSAGGMRLTEAGTEAVFFMPKIVGQSLSKAEMQINEQLVNLKAGRFDDELLEAVKVSKIVNYERAFEDQYRRGFMMAYSFTRGRTWQEVLDYPLKVRAVDRDRVIEIAKKYYGNNYLVFYSQTGFPKKRKAIKPGFQPIPSDTATKESEFAKEIADITVPELQPDFIEFGPPSKADNEVTVTELGPLVHLFYAENKVNDLFRLKISFGVGSHEKSILDPLSEYLGLVGTGQYSKKEMSGKLQILGAEMFVYSGNMDFNIVVSGPDENFDEILKIVSGLIYSPLEDQLKIKKLYQTAKTEEKYQEENPESLGYALYNYAIFGDSSDYINRMTSSDIKGLAADELITAMEEVVHYELKLHYSGGLMIDTLSEYLSKELQFDIVDKKGTWIKRNSFVDHAGNTIYFLNDKRAIQTKNYFFVPGTPILEEEKPYMNAYIDYLDGGMHSVVFQEVRELRSLAYSTGAMMYYNYYGDEPSGLVAYVGTQADKTPEAVEVMHSILCSPPAKADRIESVRKSLMQSINSSKPGFRSVSERVAAFMDRGYETDPRRAWVENYKTMDFDDIVKAYEDHFAGRPMIITIIGDKKKFNLDDLERYGKIVYVEKDDIFGVGKRKEMALSKR